jgi:pSer/pThr/pTyr-binding forkhead associated (FHA) protein
LPIAPSSSGIPGPPGIPGPRAATSPDRARERSGAWRAAAGGPAAIVVEAVDGPMDGAVLRGDFDALQIGRVVRNPAEPHLELYLDASVSSRHALLTRTDDPLVWRIEDRDSTNGTLVADEDIRGGGPRPIARGTAFMVGHSVLRWSTAGAGDAGDDASSEESFLPSQELLLGESARLLGRFSPEAAQGYGAAVALAIAEQRSFLSDRHLFLGLAAMSPELPLFARAGGPLGARFLGTVLRANEYWTGTDAWIHRRLRASSIGAQVLSKDDVAVTPRLLRLLSLAEGVADAVGSDAIRPADLVRVFLTGPVNRPRELLLREKLSPATLLTLLGPPAPPPERTFVVPAPQVSQALPVPPAPPARDSTALNALTTGDPALDARAQDVARRVYGVTALYHLAAIPDRQEALRQLLRQELAQVSEEGRPRLLRQLRRLFPLAPLAPNAAADLPAPGPARASDRRSAAAVTPVPASKPSSAAPAGSAIPWNLLIEGTGGVDLSAVDPRDRPAASLVADVFGFAFAVERFIVSVVQNVRSPGLATGQLQLPGYPTSIKKFARDVATAKPLQRDDLAEYLSAVETWLVATVMAYHEGPDLWFKDFWRKVSPAVLEAPEVKGGFLRPGAAAFWERYKKQVEKVTPDLVSDQIQQIVRQRAAEQYQQLSERRKPS